MCRRNGYDRSCPGLITASRATRCHVGPTAKTAQHDFVFPGSDNKFTTSSGGTLDKSGRCRFSTSSNNRWSVIEWRDRGIGGTVGVGVDLCAANTVVHPRSIAGIPPVPGNRSAENSVLAKTRLPVGLIPVVPAPRFKTWLEKWWIIRTETYICNRHSHYRRRPTCEIAEGQNILVHLASAINEIS